MQNIKPSLTPQLFYILLSKTPLPCRSPPRPLCSSTCCLSDLTPTPPLPICSSHTGLLAHPQFSQTHSCLKGLPLLLPLLRKFIQFSLLTSSSLCSNVTFWEATRKQWQLASSTPIPLTLLYFTPEHLTPLAMVHVYSITAPAESESMRQEELVLFFIATPMPGW